MLRDEGYKSHITDYKNCDRKRLQLLFLEEILAKLPITKLNRVVNCRVGRKQTGVGSMVVFCDF